MWIEMYGRKLDLGPKPSRLAMKRWTGAMSPEPETIAWIESLPTQSVFWDIGASVGTHAVRAAVRGLEVVAFEPDIASYRELALTKKLNRLNIYLKNCPLYERAVSGCLVAGRSTTTFSPTVVEGAVVVAATVDSLVADGWPCPDFIKLDVDGNELSILRGAIKTLPVVKSLLVEIDPKVEGHDTIPDFLSGFGFTYDPAQVEGNIYREGKYKGTANYIFWRK